MKKKRSRFFLKLVVLILAVYASVTLVDLQIRINESRDRTADLRVQLEEQKLKNDALAASFGSELDDETIAQIARQELGLVFPNEQVIVDIGH